MKVTYADDALLELYEKGETKSRKYKRLCRNKRFVDGYVRAVTGRSPQGNSPFTVSCTTRSYGMMGAAPCGW